MNRNDLTVDYKTGHLLPRLRESPDEAAGYIAASLTDNLDSPESIALAFQDVVQAYDLPIDISMKLGVEHAGLQAAVVEAAKVWAAHPETPKPLSEDIPLYDTVDALIAFEKEHNINADSA